MSNIALYRKWRPKTFLDVVEQEHVVKTLRNSLVRGRLAHAYLFCGTRGTGKTTLAHILSRAANCLSPKDGDPCNECEICTGILSGRIMDVVEIDAASNNSVDNIRRLRDDIVYAPAQARYKVYIIDEVHMLSGGAFNALLKTLEEPPEYAIFILATTEPHKLPATILSRCQRFDFRRISNDAIAARLAVVAEGAGAAAEADALLLIAKLADGALRDAISILDQCISTGAETLTRDVVMRTCGIADDAFLCESARILADGDVAAIPEHVAALAASGRGLSQYIGGLTGFFRNLMVLKF
ncbi:MAG: DNA polymerase III subunit gamma/tau, partial [Clostridiales bacterium]|nr:DNA polymerase III subunit gamma/tau [Clostridiales bacterium]